MGLEWSLKEIYSSFKSKEFLDDLKKIDDGIEELKVFSNNIYNSNDKAKNLEDFINKLISLNLVITKIFNYICNNSRVFYFYHRIWIFKIYSDAENTPYNNINY